MAESGPISSFTAAMVRECLDSLDAVAEFARTLDPENADNDPLETIQGAHIANRNAIRLQRERAESSQRDTDLLTEYGRALAQPLEPGSPVEAAFVEVVDRVQERAHELAENEPAPEHPDTIVLRALTEAVHDVVSEGFGLQRLETPFLAALERIKPAE